MAVTINDIKKLRDMTGAGLSDCKKALIESDNDITKAMELIRKRGQAIAAKREDRQAAQGIALGKTDGKFAASSLLSSPSSVRPTSLPRTRSLSTSPRLSWTSQWPRSPLTSTR